MQYYCGIQIAIIYNQSWAKDLTLKPSENQAHLEGEMGGLGLEMD